MEIKSNINVGDTVYWVKDKYTRDGKRRIIQEAVVEEITLCEYQGALYCTLNCPTNKINPNPVVHYSFVFPTREMAKDFADFLKSNPVFPPMCYGCNYAFRARQ